LPVPKDFETLEHTADTGIMAYGKDLKQAFANAARGLFSLITELEAVKEVLARDIEVSAADQDSLLVAWLNELIYIFDTENILFKRFDITVLSQRHLVARGYGERVDRARHKLKIGVKAATYHMLAVEQKDGWRLQVLFDI
jgi:SHS2 domain-containing protein